MNAILIHIKGLVQGVGFRPFIYLLAKKHNLKGWVENRNDGVRIHAEGIKSQRHIFFESIAAKAPIASNIFSIKKSETIFKNFSTFEIIKSENTSEEITEVSPDIAVCDLCMEDIKIQPHRINYPFNNCTYCGPRFTIIKDLPYDREKTSMDVFPMCDQCRSEYTDIMNRRFHAQPVACNHCGPEYLYEDHKNTLKGTEQIVKEAACQIDNGKILAIKGQGGFHLACDAENESAVSRLRKLKIREGKPFAVMFADLISLKQYAPISKTTEDALTSWQKPVVLIENTKELAPSVSLGLHTLGVMLPYMSFHYLLFDKLQAKCIVLTSGNISDEPVLIDNERAKKDLSGIYDGLITYNREIYNRTDDSVVFVANGKTRLLRRSRGFVPSPFYLNENVDGIFAAGAELVNCFAFGKGEQAILSQHIGDLKNLETLEFYTESVERFKKLFRCLPELAVCDLHPDYLSTKFARELKIPLVQVQHHHAHIASCMAEHKLDEKVIGISMDGTGYGDDGHIWGAEFFICDLSAYERITHFEYIPIPGGDKASKETWRTALSYLYHYFGEEVFGFNLDFLQLPGETKAKMIIDMINGRVNCPLSSSAGRLFDAVSAMLNICPGALFHAEAPMRLESIIAKNVHEAYPFDVQETISFKKTFEHILKDLQKGEALSRISAKFHNTIIQVIIDVVTKIQNKYGKHQVVLSGGSFQNKYLLENVENKLSAMGLEVISHQKIPSNDGGIALGQLAIAAKKREDYH